MASIIAASLDMALFQATTDVSCWNVDSVMPQADFTSLLLETIDIGGENSTRELYL